MQQYYTLEQAAQILRLSPEQLKEMAQERTPRFSGSQRLAFPRSGNRRNGPHARLRQRSGTAAGRGVPKPRRGDVFNFSLDPGESSEVPLGREPLGGDKPSRSPSPSRKTSGSKSPTPKKASSDSDVRLVMEGSNLDFSLEDEGGKAPASKAPVSPPPKKGSSKSRMAPPVKDDSGVRILPLDKPSDSDVKIVPSSPHDSDIPLVHQPPKKPSDSDIRIEEIDRGGKGEQMVTEEIDLDAEQRKADAARAKATRHRPKPGSSSMLPTASPFELSENDLDADGPAAPPAARKPQEAEGRN